MPIDPSIALSYRPIEIPNPLELYAQRAKMEQMQNQNALAKYQLSKAQRDEESQNALAEAYRTPGVLAPDGSINSNALMRALSQGRAAGQIPAVQKSLMDADKQRADVDKTKTETQMKHLQAIGGALVAAMQDPSDQNLMRQFGALKAVGLPVDASASKLMSIPDLEQRRQMIKGMAFGTPEGRAALEAVQSKAHFTDAGGSVVPVQSNPLAGPIGAPIGQAVPKTMTPGELATDRRAGATLFEQKRHNQAIEGNSGAKAPPSGYRWKGGIQGGELEPIPGGPAGKDKALTETQGNATAFGMRARDAADIINELEQKGTLGRLAGANEAMRVGAERVPVIGTALGNVGAGVVNTLMSDAQQKYQQAKINFMSAVLRKESGAVISDTEYANEDRKYFPQTGEGKGVLEQKRKARELAIEALRAQAGPGTAKIPPSRTIDAGGGWKIQRVDK